MTQALLPCPFCGTTEHLVISACGSLTADMPDRPHRVLCTHIDHDTVEGPVGYGQLAAIKAWDTRAKEQSHSPTGDDVERVARALHAEMLDMEAEGDGCRWNELSEEQLAMLDSLARAAIATLSPNGVSQSAVERAVTDDALIDIANIVTDLADANAMDRVIPELRVRVEAIAAALATQPASDTDRERG